MTNATSPQPRHDQPDEPQPQAPDLPLTASAASTEGLRLGLQKHRAAVELKLAGELDLVTAPRLLAAMEWLRRRYRHVIVVDTRGLSFVDLGGYRAFEASLHDATGERDPRVVYVVGDALAYIQSVLGTITGIHSPRLS